MKLSQIDGLIDRYDRDQMGKNGFMTKRQTKQSIDNSYNAALASDKQPYWMLNGEVRDWNAAKAEWMNALKVDRIQLLDTRWDSFATHVHYLHYLYSKAAALKLRRSEMAKRAAEIDKQIAAVENEVDGYGAGRGAGNERRRIR